MKKPSLLFLVVIALMSFTNHPSLRSPKTFVLVVDAGHGGNDLGFTSSNGIHEKELTLSIAHQIQKACKDKGVPVMLTRNEDKSVELDERVSLSSDLDSGLFISIHVNADRHDSSRSGIECIMTQQNPKYEASKKFTDVLTSELKTLTGISVNDTKQSSVYILTNNNVPTVILELGYLSNDSDVGFITDHSNQRILADKIVDSVIKYKK